MTAPSSFDVAKQIGDRFGNIIKQQTDISEIDNIFKNLESGTEQDYDDAMNQILQRVSPQNQERASKLLESRKQNALNQRYQKEYENIADQQLKDNPNDPAARREAAILKSNIPIDQKINLIKGTRNLPQDRTQQQTRLNLDSILKRYSARLKEIREERKNTRSSKKDKIKELDDLERELVKERDDLLGFQALQKSQDEEQEKISFDRDNPEHMAIFDEFDEQFKGDEDKVTEALEEIFII